MLPKLFLSWNSKDRAAADRIVRTLESYFDVWFSPEDMKAADNVHGRVAYEIAEADVALVLLSRNSVESDWVKHELSAAFQARNGPNSHLRLLVLARLDDLPVAQYPSLPTQHGLHVHDLQTDPSGSSLVDGIYSAIRLPLPLLVPATLLAMNEARFADLDLDAELRAMCIALGMQQQELKDSLAKRYGTEARSFQPFPGIVSDGANGGEDGTPASLEEFVQSVQTRLNVVRQKNAPVRVEWCWDSPDNWSQDVRKLWKERPSIVFVDSISLADPAIQRMWMNLPAPRHVDQRTIVWIPPFAGHYAHSQNNLSRLRMLDNVTTLRDVFVEFQTFGSASRDIAVDAMSPAGFVYWLLRVLNKGVSLSPVDNNQNKMPPTQFRSAPRLMQDDVASNPFGF